MQAFHEVRCDIREAIRDETREESDETVRQIRRLETVRREIDLVDEILVSLIHDRLRLAVAAADSKRRVGHALRDVRREAEVIRRASHRARDLGLDDEAVRAVFWQLIDLSHRTVGTEVREDD
ncbi:MAG: chorismate mutase [Longimicrobiales bacterium]|nr:chorismate mutase [Longimicrobiales bacterium]